MLPCRHAPCPARCAGCSRMRAGSARSTTAWPRTPSPATPTLRATCCTWWAACTATRSRSMRWTGWWRPSRARYASCLNGDLHWFDKTAENFAALEQRAARYTPLVGNVEAELRRQVDVGVGCGCAYPDCTGDDAVSRSNRIHKKLSEAVDAHSRAQGAAGGPACHVHSGRGEHEGGRHARRREADRGLGLLARVAAGRAAPGRARPVDGRQRR